MRLSIPARWRVVLYLAVGSAILWMSFRGDLLDRRMRQSAPNATNCGRVRLGTGARAASECAISAFNSHRSFRVRYDIQGIDSSVAVGIVGTREGSVTVFMFDGDPEGGGGTSLIRQRVSEYACPAPVKLFLSQSSRVSCFPPAPNSEHNIMSPSFESY